MYIYLIRTTEWLSFYGLGRQNSNIQNRRNAYTVITGREILFLF